MTQLSGHGNTLGQRLAWFETNNDFTLDLQGLLRPSEAGWRVLALWNRRTRSLVFTGRMDWVSDLDVGWLLAEFLQIQLCHLVKKKK